MTDDRRPSSVSAPQKYKFQDLEVYQLALRYLDCIYELSQCLPEVEEYNQRSQMERATTSVVLDIAEGSRPRSSAIRLGPPSSVLGRFVP